jgi:hypothetical protein
VSGFPSSFHANRHAFFNSIYDREEGASCVTQLVVLQRTVEMIQRQSSPIHAMGELATGEARVEETVPITKRNCFRLSILEYLHSNLDAIPMKT